MLLILSERSTTTRQQWPSKLPSVVPFSIKLFLSGPRSRYPSESGLRRARTLTGPPGAGQLMSGIIPRTSESGMVPSDIIDWSVPAPGLSRRRWSDSDSPESESDGACCQCRKTESQAQARPVVGQTAGLPKGGVTGRAAKSNSSFYTP